MSQGKFKYRTNDLITVARIGTKTLDEQAISACSEIMSLVNAAGNIWYDVIEVPEALHNKIQMVRAIQPEFEDFQHFPTMYEPQSEPENDPDPEPDFTPDLA